MKKVLFMFLTAALLLCFCASASADFTLPRDLKTIGEEAFAGVKVETFLVIPEGVETIGARAFSGASCLVVSLPNSVKSIAPDAFDSGVVFNVVPGSYGRSWCREHHFEYADISFTLNKQTLDIYPGHDGVLSAEGSYSELFSFRWEKSTDQENWTVIENENTNILKIGYQKEPNRIFVRCRAAINNITQEYTNDVCVDFYGGPLKFDEGKCRALSGDAVFLDWDLMGRDISYTIRKWVPDDSAEGGYWEAITDTGESSCTVYGLEKETKYDFMVTATIEREGEEPFWYDSEALSVTTLREPTSIVMKDCRTDGTALYASWEPLTGAVYDVEAVCTEDSSRVTIAQGISDAQLNYYVLSPNSRYQVQVNARIAQGGQEIVIEGARTSVTTGSADPIVVGVQAVPVGETVQVSWTELPDASYFVYLDGETTPSAAADIGYCDIGGLEGGRTYTARVQAVVGDWQSRLSEPVTFKAEAKKEAGAVEYRALLVGEVSFPGTQYAARNYGDVERLADMLARAKTPEGGSYSFLRRKDLTKAELIGAIAEAFQNADDNDVSLLYIGTHGDTNSGGSNAGSLGLVDSAGKEESILLEELAAELGKVPGKVIFWLGSCGSGAAVYEEGVPQNGDPDFDPAARHSAALEAFAAYETAPVFVPEEAPELTAGETAAFETGEFRRAGKFYVLTASRFRQESWGVEEDRYTYFAKYICEGLEEENGFLRADADRDGKVTQQELFLYIKAREDSQISFQNVQCYPLNSDYVLFVS